MCIRDRQDGTVRIYDFSQSVGEINREFARNGLLVTRINDSEENLEDYFSKPVSYTHLDVYKRQFEHWPGCFWL